MWTVVYIANNRTQAEMLKQILNDEGVLATIRPVGVSQIGDGMFELLVLESEVEEAQNILCEHITKR